MKKCPFCTEEIQDDAIKCKHCGAWLDGDRKGQPPARDRGGPRGAVPIVRGTAEVPDPLAEKPGSGRGWLIVASVLGAVVLLGIMLSLLTGRGEKKADPQKAYAAGQYFAVGSTREEVLRIQGPPTFKLEMVWFYEDSQVQFDSDGKVSYIWNYSKNLKIKPEKRP